MEEAQQMPVKKKSPKMMIGLLVGIIILAGGAAAAFMYMNKSPKAQYFMAEGATLQAMGATLEERYKNEMNWMKIQQEKPTETVLDLSGEWNDPYVDYDMEEIQSIVNSSTVTLRNVFDPVQKETEVEIGGNVGSTEITLGNLYITAEKALLALPFTKDLIRFDDNDWGRLMRESNEDYEGDEKLGLEQLFETEYFTSNELSTYIRQEYVEFMFAELPDDAFTTEKDEIELYGKKAKAKKVTMDLSEAEVKSLLEKLLVKIKNDEKLKEMLADQSAFSGMNMDTEFLMEDFENGIDEAIDELDNISMPNGIKSTIWQNSNRILKRDFAISVEDMDEESTLRIKGTQLFEKDVQKWDYDLAVEDSYGDEEMLKFTGDLSWKDNKSDDSISINVEEMKLTYKGQEELKNNVRTFTRTFGMSDGYTSPKLVWTGTAEHNKDSMEAEHAFTIKDRSMEPNMYNVVVNQKGKVVKKVDMPEEGPNTVLLKDMNIEEIEEYFEYDLMPQAQEWFMDLIYDLEDELYK